MNAMSSTFNFRSETLGHLLADRWLTVPPYQRGYAWEEEQVREFWDDIDSALQQGRQYFVGAVVVTKDGSAYQVIDGQQRLATTALLLAALRDELAQLGDTQLQQDVDQRFLRSFDRRAGTMRPRLRVAPADLEFFTKRFLERSGGEPTTPSQHRLTDAFGVLRNQVAGIKAGQASEKRSTAINNWLDHLEQSVFVVLVEADSEADAFRVFETLNDRGATLTIADLLKNYLLSNAKANAVELGALWDDAVANLGAERDPHSLVTFIRHFWNSKVGATRERDLYASIRNEVQGAAKAKTLVSEMGEASIAYAAILDPAHPRWAEAPDEASRAIETLLYFQLGQYRPLLLAGIEEFDGPEVAQLAAALVSWSFRGLLFGGIGGGTAERVYASAAVAVRTRKAKSVSDVFKTLRQIVPNDEDFRNAFEGASLRRVRLAHYVMRAFERNLANDPSPALEPYPPEKRPLVSAPLLPHKGAEKWSGFADEERERYAYQIGNLILRPPGRQVDSPLEPKDRIAWASKLGPLANRDLGRLRSWTPDAIRHRQQDLAAQALKIWPREP